MTSASLLAVFGLGGPELLLILAVVLLLFGAKKLPELAKGLGRSVKEFKKASNEIEEEEQAAKAAPAPVANAEAKKPESTSSTSTH
jgi:sec-independent protein translocase protein TatA